MKKIMVKVPKQNCVKCQHFNSWYSILGDNDPYEPRDIGDCVCKASRYYQQCKCTEYLICEYFTKEK